MARRVVTEERVVDIPDDRLDNRAAQEPALNRDQLAAKNVQLNKLQQLIYTILGIINGLLLIRFIFSLLGANPANGIADFIYTVTDPLVDPFRNLFSVTDELGTARFEVETLIAILFYSLIAYAIVKLIGIGKNSTAA